MISRKTGDLAPRIDTELRRELAGLGDRLLELESATRHAPVSEATVSQLRDLENLGTSFRSVSDQLLSALELPSVARPLIGTFAQLNGDIVTSSRKYRDYLSSDAVNFATYQESARRTVFVGSMLLTAGIGILLVTFVSLRVRRELSLRRNAERQLVTANRELERFAATVAHDLNGPLHNLSLGAHVLERTLSSTSPQVALTPRR
jgi:signal transduction histidine kinase